MPNIHPKYIMVSLMENSPYRAISWGMYPTRLPGTPEPFVPGLPPNTHISPSFNLRLPTMQERRVVLPQPDAPNRPYLENGTD